LVGVAAGTHESKENGRFRDASTVTVSTRPGNDRIIASFVRCAAGRCTQASVLIVPHFFLIRLRHN
jgi:hypothetical protein